MVDQPAARQLWQAVLACLVPMEACCDACEGFFSSKLAASVPGQISKAAPLMILVSARQGFVPVFHCLRRKLGRNRTRRNGKWNGPDRGAWKVHQRVHMIRKYCGSYSAMRRSWNIPPTKTQIGTTAQVRDTPQARKPRHNMIPQVMKRMITGMRSACSSNGGRSGMTIIGGWSDISGSRLAFHQRYHSVSAGRNSLWS